MVTDQMPVDPFTPALTDYAHQCQEKPYKLVEGFFCKIKERFDRLNANGG
jgi:hypothetical protein